MSAPFMLGQQINLLVVHNITGDKVEMGIRLSKLHREVAEGTSC